jgi:putative ABC transport system permease protein
MDILESIKMAAKTLKANKLRSILTMLGITIGNASVITIVGVGQGGQRLAAEQFESLGPNVLFIVPGSRKARNTTFDLPKTLVIRDAEAIASQVPTVKEVAPQINSRAVASYRNNNMDALVIGVTPEFLSVRNFDIAKGRFVSSVDVQRNNRVAILGKEIADRLFLYQNPIGQQIRLKNISFDVIGVMEAKGSFMGNNQDETVFIPISTMSNQIVGKRNSPYGMQVSFISVSAKDEESVDAARFQIKNLLRLRHKIVAEDDFGIETQKDILEIVNTVTTGLTLMLGAIAAISLLVGGLGVMNIMLVSVTERTQEIGLRKAIGAQEKDILIQFLIEAVILAFAGGLLGIGIGVGGTVLVATFSPLSASVSPISIILAVGVSSFIGLFFGVFPARQAAKLDPIVALRSA